MMNVQEFCKENDEGNVVSQLEKALVLSVKILLERSELRSDIRPESARARNYETARNNVAAWLQQVQA